MNTDNRLHTFIHWRFETGNYYLEKLEREVLN